MRQTLEIALLSFVIAVSVASWNFPCARSQRLANMGISLAQQHHPDAAAVYLESALQLDPDNSRAMRALAKLYEHHSDASVLLALSHAGND